MLAKATPALLQLGPLGKPGGGDIVVYLLDLDRPLDLSELGEVLTEHGRG